MGNTSSQTKLTLDEELKLHKRSLQRAIRELDREKMRLGNQEKKTIVEMKKLAKQNQVSSVKILAKDLLRCRKFQSRFLEMKAQLTGVQLQLQTMKSSQAMADAMKGTTKIMIRMNQQTDVKEVTKIMQEFMTENERQKLTQEALSEAVDETMEDDEVEEEAVVAQVLDEIGIQLNGELKDVKTNDIKNNAIGSQPVPAQEAGFQAEEDHLEARLNALKR